MTAITFSGGAVVLRDGKVGTEEACCCGEYEYCFFICKQTLIFLGGPVEYQQSGLPNLDNVNPEAGFLDAWSLAVPIAPGAVRSSLIFCEPCDEDGYQSCDERYAFPAGFCGRNDIICVSQCLVSCFDEGEFPPDKCGGVGFRRLKQPFP